MANDPDRPDAAERILEFTSTVSADSRSSVASPLVSVSTFGVLVVASGPVVANTPAARGSAWAEVTGAAPAWTVDRSAPAKYCGPSWASTSLGKTGWVAKK